MEDKTKQQIQQELLEAFLELFEEDNNIDINKEI